MAETIIMPKLGFDMAEGTLVRWVKAEGESIAKGEVLAEIETDKATVEVESTTAGLVYRHLVEKGTPVPVGEPIAIITAPGENPPSPIIATATTVENPAMHGADQKPEPALGVSTQIMEKEAGGLVRISPLARKLAKEAGLELQNLKGSGPEGRIVRRDVEAALEAGAKPGTPLFAQGEKQGQIPEEVMTPPSARLDEHIPLNKLRSAIARRMSEAVRLVPHFYVTRSFDAGEVVRLRKQYNDLLPEAEQISVNDFIVKAVALALRQHPDLNASFHETEILRHGHINIGIAVAVEGGLLTVVCPDANLKPIQILSQELKQRTARAREGKVKPADIEGSTFSISNLGMYDVDHFTAIINPPESAILAVGAIQQMAVVEQNRIVPGYRMKATLSADHRVTDGAEAARFLKTLALFIEQPFRLFVG